METLLSYFLGMLTLVFSVASFIAGVFTAYFGSGKSRAVGAVLIIIGIIVFVIFLWGAHVLSFMGTPPAIIDFYGTVQNGVVFIIGGVVGALIALGIFLLAIMKA